MDIILKTEKIVQEVPSLEDETFMHQVRDSVKSPLIFSYQLNLKAKSGSVEYGSVRLIPGANLGIDDEVYNAAKKQNKQMQYFIAEGVIEEYEPDDLATPEAQAAGLGAQDFGLTTAQGEKAAIALIQATFNLNWVQICLQRESRPTVVDHLRRKQVELTRIEKQAEAEIAATIGGTQQGARLY